jgi:hypothetical protein
LHAGRDHLDAEQQSDGTTRALRLIPLVFARLLADRIGVGPPFSVAFMARVPMMAAVGDGSCPSASRLWTSRV